MLFNEEFVESIAESPILTVIEICTRLHDSMRDDGRDWSSEEIANVTETFSLLRAIEEAGIIDFDKAVPDISGTPANDSMAMMNYIDSIRESLAGQAKTLQVDQLKMRFSNSLKAGFGYEFSAGDIERIQTLLSELRDHISKSNAFGESHQRRLLARLEKLQAELHKRVSDLDRFWGLMGETGVALGKLGTDAKPIVDRIREITDIVWRSQARAEELPSNSPSPALPAPRQSDGHS